MFSWMASRWYYGERVRDPLCSTFLGKTHCNGWDITLAVETMPSVTESKKYNA